jgi:hypothetical protein
MTEIKRLKEVEAKTVAEDGKIREHLNKARDDVHRRQRMIDR